MILQRFIFKFLYLYSLYLSLSFPVFHRSAGRLSAHHADLRRLRGLSGNVVSGIFARRTASVCGAGEASCGLLAVHLVKLFPGMAGDRRRIEEKKTTKKKNNRLI
jgi:hypothetical protein